MFCLPSVKLTNRLHQAFRTSLLILLRRIIKGYNLNKPNLKDIMMNADFFLLGYLDRYRNRLLYIKNHVILRESRYLDRD